MNLLLDKEYEEYELFFNNCIHQNEYFNTVIINISENTTDFKSIIVCSDATMYRAKVDSTMIGRIKLTGKKPYISFKEKYLSWFKNKNVIFYNVKSDIGYFRIEISEFEKIESDITFPKLLTDMCLDAMSFNTFGCCAKYVECSNKRQCVHDDQLYATSCMYRKNLENGRIFYGKNKNI